MEKPSSVKLMPTRNYDYLTVKSFPEVCRVCLAKRDVLKPLAEVNFTHNLNINGFPECVHLTNVVKQFCNITLSSFDQMPQSICESCIDMAAKAFGFFQLFTYSNIVLKKKLAEENAVPIKENILPEIYTIEDDSDEDCIMNEADNFVFKKPFPVVKNLPPLDTNQTVGVSDIEVFVIPETEKVVACPKFNPAVRWVLKDHNYSRINKPQIKLRVKQRPPKEKKPRIRIRVKKPPKPKPVVDKSILRCKLCKTVEFRAPEEVLEHFEENHSTHFRCIICNLPLRRRSSRKFHVTCHFPNKFPCRPCQIIFDSSEALKTHERSNDHINRKMCHICGKVFKLAYRKIEHIKSVHMRSKDYQCAKCGATFSFSANLRRHELRHEQPKRFLCQECGKAFTTNFVMKIHLQNIHKIDHGISIPKLQQSRKQWKRHYNERRTRRTLPRNPGIRGPPKIFTCSTCSVKFLSYSMYLTHCSSHPEFTEYPCEECEEIFTSLEEYLCHEETHKKYPCKVCGMRFKQKAAMYQHKYSHRPPVECPVCNKEIKDNLCLKQHMLTHTREKPHVCEQCGKSYRQSASLRAHMFGAHGSKPYECHLCDKKFMYNSELRAHIRVHTGERPFACPYCDKPFRDTTSRHKHVKSEHPERMQEFIIYKETYQADEVKRAALEC